MLDSYVFSYGSLNYNFCFNLGFHCMRISTVIYLVHQLPIYLFISYSKFCTSRIETYNIRSKLNI